MDNIGEDHLKQLDDFLSRPNQIWLLGAGVSKEAGIPLMHPLTTRVLELLAGSECEILFKSLAGELDAKSHIEHILSQLGDYAALCKRGKTGAVSIAGNDYTMAELEKAHSAAVGHIADTIRWGYSAANGTVPMKAGTRNAPIVSVTDHKNFVEALIGIRQAGLDGRRRPTRIFTINYDTLIEDALALSGYSYWDGFSGGAIAFRTFTYGTNDPNQGYKVNLIKLHGSIDWFLTTEGRVVRAREGDNYPDKNGRILIYPQATKYVETQRDPFSSQFDLLRRSLSDGQDSVLAICGYSFGDDHINQEIEIALSSPASKFTILAFCFQGDELPPALARWRTSESGKRVYIMTQKGLYAGDTGPHMNATAKNLDWWTFAGVTNVLANGAEAVIL